MVFVFVIISLLLIGFFWSFIIEKKLKREKKQKIERKKEEEENTQFTKSVNDLKFKNDAKIDYIFDKSSLPKKYKNLIPSINQWFNHSGSFVKKDDPLVNLSFVDFSEGSSDIYAEYDGWLEVHKQKSYDDYSLNVVNENDLIFTIHKKLDDDKILELRNSFLQNIPNIEEDNFLEIKELKWKSICGNCFSYNSDINDSIILWGSTISDLKYKNHPLIFTLNNIDGKDYIIFKFPKETYKLKKDCIISFMFKNNFKIDFIITSKPIKTNLNWSWDSEIHEIRMPLMLSEIEILKTKSLTEWQIYIPSQEKIRGVNDSNFNQFAINKFLKDYCSVIDENISDYNPVISRDVIESKKTNEICYVYLMIDYSSGRYKIGISNKPEYRERTLQSEKPTIEMICNKRYVNRKMALSFEKALHETYKDKRFRGEWFNLTNDDVEELKITLNS